MANITEKYVPTDYELFHEQLDALNFEGYSEMLYKESPQLYEFEKEQFLRNYCDPIIIAAKSRKR